MNNPQTRRSPAATGLQIEQNTHDSNLALAAAQLAASGWKIHPLRPNSKLPILPGWPALATNDAATVHEWWTATPAAGIGIATGEGRMVLDVDTKDGKQGSAALSALILANRGEFPATLTAQTPSGGFHFYFACNEPVRNSAGKLGDGLDVRGAGGYVCAPPTVIDGRAYLWLDPATPIAPAPAWLVAAALAAAPVTIAQATAETIEPTAELLADLRSALLSLPADDRDMWIRAGAALRCLGEPGRELWLDWSAGSDKHNPDCDPQVFDTIGHDSTGPAAIFKAAQAAGWENPLALRKAAALFGRQPIESGGPTLRTVNIADVMSAHVSAPRFVVDRLIPCGHLTLFGSHGGSGKSILALTIGAHVAAGVPWAGFAVQQCHVLYASLEDAGEIVRFRLRKIVEAYALDAAAVIGNLSIVDGSAGLTALMSERFAFGVRQLEPTATLVELRAAVGAAGLILIDNASDAFGGSENDRQQVRTFVRALAALGHANHAGVVLLAHIDKAAAKFGAAGNSYSGSSAWHNSARSRLALVTKGAGVTLVQEKLNLGKASDPVRLRWIDPGVLMPDGGAADVSGSDDAQAVLHVISAAIRDGVTVSTARSGPATTQRILESVPEFPPHLRGTHGRDDFWAAITDLQRSGRIVVEEYRTAARHARERFVIAPVAPVAPVPDN